MPCARDRDGQPRPCEVEGRSNRVDCWGCRFYIESREMRATCLSVRVQGYVPLECMPVPPCSPRCPSFQPIELRQGSAKDENLSFEASTKANRSRWRRWAKANPEELRLARVAARAKYAGKFFINKTELEVYKRRLEEAARELIKARKLSGVALAASTARQDPDLAGDSEPELSDADETTDD